MIIYYNPKEKYSYNTNLVKNCNLHDIEFILFDPIEEMFYSRDLLPLKSELKLTFRSNIDCFSSTNPYLIFKDNDLLENYAIQRNFKSYLACKDETIFNCQKIEILKILKTIIGLNFEVICLFQYDWRLPFLTPEKNYLLLFESKENNDYIYYFNKDNETFICGNLKNNSFYDAGLISSYIKYQKGEKISFYVLRIEEKKK